MSQLEKLTLSISVHGRTSFIDGTHLDNDIISQMPYLHTFIFDIITEHVTIYKGYNVGCYVDYLWTETGRCHIYSLPFTMEYIQAITNKFTPGGVFMFVRKLCVSDLMRSIEYEFFVLISQAFPLLEDLTVLGTVNQKKQSVKLDEYEQTCSIIEYSHLVTLDLIMSHVDYGNQFLVNTNIRLPRLSTLTIDYENLVTVINDFTSNIAHTNCAKSKEH